MLLKEKIVKILNEKKYTLTTIESATCGLIASELGSVSGASSIFMGGLITYSAEIKSKLLGIDISIINKYGTVSSDVAELMVINGCQLMNTNCGISVTGIAGPSSIENKPVGLFYIGLKVNSNVLVKKILIKEPLTRNQYRRKIVNVCFKELLKLI